MMLVVMEKVKQRSDMAISFISESDSKIKTPATKRMVELATAADMCRNVGNAT